MDPQGDLILLICFGTRDWTHNLSWARQALAAELCPRPQDLLYKMVYSVLNLQKALNILVGVAACTICKALGAFGSERRSFLKRVKVCGKSRGQGKKVLGLYSFA